MKRDIYYISGNTPMLAKRFIRQLPWSVVLLLCVFLGFAPFSSRPHLLEKIVLLSQGLLTRPVDIFDLLFHGSPFVLLFVKILCSFPSKRQL